MCKKSLCVVCCGEYGFSYWQMRTDTFMYQLIVHFKLNSMVRSTPFNPSIFIQMQSCEPVVHEWMCTRWSKFNQRKRTKNIEWCKTMLAPSTKQQFQPICSSHLSTWNVKNRIVVFYSIWNFPQNKSIAIQILVTEVAR